jgi:O-antigen ligase
VMVSAVFVGMVAIGVIAATPNYLIRVKSIFSGNIEGSGDMNSREARKELLIDSLTIMTAHPVFGIGPGDLPSYTQTWRVAHNTYAELGAETGVPGFLLFLLLLGLTLRKIKRVQKLPGYQASEDIRLWTSGLWAAMAAYTAGALFSSTEYNLFPYFMVGYVCAVYQIASVSPASREPQQQSKGDKKLPDHARRSQELVWTR